MLTVVELFLLGWSCLLWQSAHVSALWAVWLNVELFRVTSFCFGWQVRHASLDTEALRAIG